MKRNYLFRSNKFAKRYFKGLLLYQAFGLVAFLSVSTALYFLRVNETTIIYSSLIVVTAWAFYTAETLHRNDFSLLRLGMWPFDTIEDAVKWTRKLIVDLEDTSAHLERNQRHTEGLLIRIVEMQKKLSHIPTPEANQLRKELSSDYRDMVENRAKSKETQKEIAQQLNKMYAQLKSLNAGENSTVKTIISDRKQALDLKSVAVALINSFSEIGKQIREYELRIS